MTSKDTIDMPERRFQAHFEPRQRGHIATLSLDPVRRGMTEPHRIVSAVRHDLLAQVVRWKRWGNHDGKERNERIVRLIDTHFDEAVDYARWALWWESLSYTERKRIKAERCESYRRQYMDQQPATEKQIAYLRALGWTGEIQSKLDASERIDRLKKQISDTEYQQGCRIPTSRREKAEKRACLKTRTLHGVHRNLFRVHPPPSTVKR